MSAPKWVHCNVCYYLLSKKDRRFFLMSCQHTLCKVCMAQTNRGTCCPVCKRQGLQFVEICNSMDKKFKALFAPDVAKGLEPTCKIINFQAKQRQHLIDYLAYMDEKLLKADQVEQRLKQKIYELQQCYQKTREYRRSQQEALRQQVTLEATAEDFESPPLMPANRAATSNSGGYPSSKKQTSFFEDNSRSSGSNGSRLSTDSRVRRNSFLNLKGSSSSSGGSIRSADFGTTPSSGDRSAASRISETFHNMTLGSG